MVIRNRRQVDVTFDHPFAARYGRPRANLPIDKIMELHKNGYSCRGIVRELAKMGITTSKDTVNRIVKN